MTLTWKPLTNSAYGYPKRGDERRITPFILAVVHVTDNATNQGSDAVENEWTYANRPNSTGPSAHVYLGRDGNGYIAIDPKKYAAWSNGILNEPNTKLATINKVIELKASSGINPNECCYYEIEDVGVPGTRPVTSLQHSQIADLIAQASIDLGVEISRETVVTHTDFDAVNRITCAYSASTREARLAELINLAAERKKSLLLSADLALALDKTAKLTTDLTLATAKISQMDLTVQELERQIDVATAKVEAQNIEVSALNEQVKLLGSENVLLSEQVTNVKAENIILNAEIAALNDQLSQLRVAWRFLDKSLGAEVLGSLR